MTPTQQLQPITRVGPVRWVQLLQPDGVAAQRLAEDWLTETLDDASVARALVRDVHGRPRFPDQSGYDVSWSHSGGRLLVALAEGVEVGADIEQLRPRLRALEIAQRFFAPGEYDWLAALPDTERMLAFARIWCAKEAVLKAHGRGIAFGLHRFEIGQDATGAMQLQRADPALGAAEEWSLHEFTPAPGFHAALAWRPR